MFVDLSNIDCPSELSAIWHSELRKMFIKKMKGIKVIYFVGQ